MIGIFDSGIGGLSVLRALRHEMPSQDYFYLADSAHAPYGERDDAYVIARAKACVKILLDQGCTLVVIACNTATAVAAQALRMDYPLLPLIGIEPAIKPAAEQTRNGHVGVLATQGTLRSHKFQSLLAKVQVDNPAVHFHLHAPSGLALAIEQQDTMQIQALVQAACQALSEKACDTVVLGCTHYPLVQGLFTAQFRAQLAGPFSDQRIPLIQLIDPARAVARQAQKRLPTTLRATIQGEQQGQLRYASTGDAAHLQRAMTGYVLGTTTKR